MLRLKPEKDLSTVLSLTFVGLVYLGMIYTELLDYDNGLLARHNPPPLAK